MQVHILGTLGPSWPSVPTTMSRIQIGKKKGAPRVPFFFDDEAMSSIYYPCRLWGCGMPHTNKMKGVYNGRSRQDRQW